jgi:MFS family permease
VSALVSYTSIVFGDLSFDEQYRHLLSASFTITFTVVAFVPLFLIDKVGRYKLFLVATIGMFVSIAVLASTTGKSLLDPVSLTFMFLYSVSYVISFLSLLFLYVSEIAPIRLRILISAIPVTR